MILFNDFQNECLGRLDVTDWIFNKFILSMCKSYINQIWPFINPVRDNRLNKGNNLDIRKHHCKEIELYKCRIKKTIEPLISQIWPFIKKRRDNMLLKGNNLDIRKHHCKEIELYKRRIKKSHWAINQSNSTVYQEKAWQQT